MKSTATTLLAAAQSEGTLRPDLTPTDLLRLTQGVATAAELGGGEAVEIGRYLGWLLNGIRVNGD